MNTNVYLKVKELLNNADAVVIGAGAGISTAAGVNYGEYMFKENFPELYKKYGFTNFYTSSFYKFLCEEERWSYWAKHINYLCLSMGKTQVYQNLKKLVKDKDYFVITTNADKQFIKNDFDENKIFEVQGTLTKIQCSKGCHNKLYDDTKMIKEMLKKDKDCKVPSDLVPYCPKCGEKMELNLRKDNYFVEDEYWYKKQDLYEKFINKYKNKNILFLELGVGFNTPSIIRFPFEEFTFKFSNANLVRINMNFADVPNEIGVKSITICDDIAKVLKELA